MSLALDDFGTGFSSLTHLRTLPIDRVKIDRSFISELPASREDAALTSAIITMVHGLKLQVVAEGVETEEQAHFLIARQCDEMQGYLFSRPLPADELLRTLEEEKPSEDDALQPSPECLPLRSSIERTRSSSEAES